MSDPEDSADDQLENEQGWEEMEDYEDGMEEEILEEENIDDDEIVVEEEEEEEDYEEKYIPPEMQEFQIQNQQLTQTPQKSKKGKLVATSSVKGLENIKVSEFVEVQPKNPFDMGEYDGDNEMFNKKRWKRANPEAWERNVTKKLRNSGQAYKGKNGVVPAKTPKPIDCSNCKFKCTFHFTEEDRAAICSSYWKLEDYCRKKDFILMNVKSVPPKRRKEQTISGKQRTNAKIFYFQKFDTSYRVCQSFFLKTLAISNGPLMKAFEKVNCYTNFFDGQDQRGRHPPANKLSDEDVRKIKEHIESFPFVEVARKKSKKRLLESSLTIQKMYNLYKDIATSRGDKVPSITTYKRIFGRFFNYSFMKKPKKDRQETTHHQQQPETIKTEKIVVHQTIEKLDLASLKQEHTTTGAQYENFNIQVIEIPADSVYTYG